MTDKKAEYLEILTNEYLPAFFVFSISRTNNALEAEELSQEIAYQCVTAINKIASITNFNAYVWSIAHNTYKRHLKKKEYFSLDDDKIINTFSNYLAIDIPLDTDLIRHEEAERIKTALSIQSGLYRKVLVYFYYDELTIAAIAKKLDLSQEMVKFYLQKGRQKLKETLIMNNSDTKKSFDPSEFSVYKSAIDFSRVNVWEVFKRKLPCQIALVCHDKEKSISEISLEIGVPATYLEEETALLIDAGVMISPAKGKYRTNFFILKTNTANQAKEQFEKLHEQYVPHVIKMFDKHLPELKNCGVFTFDVPDNRYAWFFMNDVVDFNSTDSPYMTDDDYPQILSCGSKGFIFAEENKSSSWTVGCTPTRLEKCTVLPRDLSVLGEYHFQKELWDAKKAQALYDVYKGDIKDCDKELYAQLIKESYVVNNNGKLLCNVAVSTKASRELLEKINAKLSAILPPLCNKLRENISKIVKASIPPQLKDYTKGYVETWISFYSSVKFREALYNKGFIKLPQKHDNTPLACNIYEN